MLQVSQVKENLNKYLSIINLFNNIGVAEGVVYFEPLASFYLVTEFLPAEEGVTLQTDLRGIDITKYILDNVDLGQSSKSLHEKIRQATEAILSNKSNEVHFSFPSGENGFYIWFKK